MWMATEASRAAANRRFLALLGVSCGLHAAVLAWVQRPSPGPAAPKPPALLASIRSAQLVAATAPASLAPVAPPPETRARPPRAQPQVKRFAPQLAADRPAQRVALAAVPPPAAREAAAAPSLERAVAAAPIDALPTAAATATAETASPAAVAPPAVAQGALEDAYRRHVVELLRRRHEYPRVAEMRGWEGEVRLRLRVARKGSLVAVAVDRSSGFEILDRHALAMVEHLPALPPLPPGLLASEIQFVIPVLYRVDKPT